MGFFLIPKDLEKNTKKLQAKTDFSWTQPTEAQIRPP